MKEEHYIYIIVLLVLYLIFNNSCRSNEYFGSGPAIFLPDGYGEGAYSDNIKLEPVYRENTLPTIYDS